LRNPDLIEHTVAEQRYKKIIMKPEEIDRLLVDVFLQAHVEAPEQIVLTEWSDPYTNGVAARVDWGEHPYNLPLAFVVAGNLRANSLLEDSTWLSACSHR
jgi:hypothetical protein